MIPTVKIGKERVEIISALVDKTQTKTRLSVTSSYRLLLSAINKKKRVDASSSVPRTGMG